MRALRDAAIGGLQKGGRRRIARRSRFRSRISIPSTPDDVRARAAVRAAKSRRKSVGADRCGLFQGMASERFDTCRNRVGNVGASIVRRRRIVHLLVAPLFPRIDIAISVSGRRLSPSPERALATPRWMTDMSVGSRGGGSESEPQASAPILSDIEALVLASAVLGVAYALLS
jgi:hypothetical protein